jgi:replicative DNA helicase
MEQTSSKLLKYKHISSATNEIIEYIKDRRTGSVKSLRTRWFKFNKLCMGGIEPNAIYSVAGISGSGKSSFVNALETDLIDLNRDEKTIVLSFSFEMLSSKQVGRKLSYKLKKTTSELYSASDNGALSDTDLERVEEAGTSIKDYPVYYVDTPGTVPQIAATIEFFQNTIAKGKWLVVIIDHTLLINGSGSEREIIVDLEKVLIGAKKVGKTSIIQISQMNRNIEASERMNNPTLHYPQRGDLSASDAVFQASDYVLVIHRPEVLGLMSYGYNNLPVKDCIYMHFLKNREGVLKVLKFTNDLKYNNIKEFDDEAKKDDQQKQLEFD